METKRTNTFFLAATMEWIAIFLCHVWYLPQFENLSIKKCRKLFSPDLLELIPPPVSSHDDDDLVSSSAPLKMDSSDVHRLFDDPAFLLFRCALISAMGLAVCVDVVLYVPFVMVISSKSSSIFNTGKWLWWPVAARSYGLAYFSSTSTVCFRLPLDDVCSGRSFGRSTLNDCNGMYACVNDRNLRLEFCTKENDNLQVNLKTTDETEMITQHKRKRKSLRLVFFSSDS